jgi:hypothetical protein
MLLKFKCKAPEGQTEKAYKVWNGKSYSWLAKSMMWDIDITGDTMTFSTTPRYADIHKAWLQRVDNTSSTLDV